MRAALPLTLIAIATFSCPAPTLAEDAFSTGPALNDFGPAATVPNVASVPPTLDMRLRFDVSDGAETGKLNRHFVTAARFLNMHARTGVAPERMHLAVVIHGRAVFDVVRKGAHESANSDKNGALVEALQEHGVAFFVCGQSAAYYGVEAEQLLPGVEMSLSAMTAHLLLAADGYELNPF